MKEPVNEVSKQILEILSKKGGVTLLELERELDVSYNLIFLAIDNMVTSNKIRLKRCGRDYLLSGVDVCNNLLIEDSCVNEYLCQDV